MYRITMICEDLFAKADMPRSVADVSMVVDDFSIATALTALQAFVIANGYTKDELDEELALLAGKDDDPPIGSPQWWGQGVTLPEGEIPFVLPEDRLYPA